jgi:hypothetical protein
VVVINHEGEVEVKSICQNMKSPQVDQVRAL